MRFQRRSTVVIAAIVGCFCAVASAQVSFTTAAHAMDDAASAATAYMQTLSSVAPLGHGIASTDSGAAGSRLNRALQEFQSSPSASSLLLAYSATADLREECFATRGRLLSAVTAGDVSSTDARISDSKLLTAAAELNRAASRLLSLVQGSMAAPRSPSVPTYPGPGPGHWIKANARGHVIVLEDGSIWAISSLDQTTAALWLPVTSIIVLPVKNASSDDSYSLVDTEDKEVVTARYLGREQ